MTPRYPIYVISKGRHATALTPLFLQRDGVPYKLVVEPQERDLYAARFGEANVLTLPFSNLGLGGIPARNWVWEHARAAGARRHWILDDNMRMVRRLFRGKRIRCTSGKAFAAVEDFVDRYTNVAVAGLNYTMFVLNDCPVPFYRNVHVYSCLLIDDMLTERWRGRYNEDTDLCLQVLAAGLCTVLVNAFMVDKMQTMKMGGGNSSQLYQGDGRLKMARSLERVWPYVVEVDRRFKRPQHVVRYAWRRFDTPLKRKPGVEASGVNDYGLSLEAVGEIKSPRLQELVNACKSN